MGRIDTSALLSRIDLVEVVGRYVKLKKSGNEWSGLCPFHDESTPSFTVIPLKGFAHCFGCGAHCDAIGFLMRILGIDFREAVKQLDSGALAEDFERVAPPPKYVPDTKWVVISPVPDDAPQLLTDGGWTVPIWNPKRKKANRLKVSRLDAYRNAAGGLLGYVARAEIKDRDTGKVKKWTPTITWCVSPTGARQWCIVPFPDPRPLLGLDDLAARPEAPVLIVEGEKCRAAGASAWPNLVVLSWPGGTNGLRKVDWTPLAGRDVILWPDADAVGLRAMCGWSNDAGDFVAGVAQYAARVGARSIRMVEVEGQPKGWDIADAMQVDGWTAKQLTAWVAARTFPVHVFRG